jgi:Tfp pilus assembly protein PilE
MSIVATLAIGGTASYVGSQQRARDARRKADLEVLRQALEYYYVNNNAYPNNTITGSTQGALKTTLTNNNCKGSPCISGGAYPKDPQTVKNYYYSGVVSATTYELCAQFEKPISTDDRACGVAAVPNCGVGFPCTYGVTQP